MLRKDYLLQQIEMLSGLVTRLLHMRTSDDEQAAIDEIDQTYRELFGLEPSLISLLPTDILLDKLRSGEFIDLEQGFTLAVVLREDALNFLTRGDSLEHYQRLTRSLKIFLTIALEHNLAPEQVALYDVDAVLAQMGDYVLPLDLQVDLFHYYEDASQFARADDELHELLTTSDNNADVIDEGISFYEWLLTQSDEDLEAGNLPRNEVEESLVELRHIKPTPPA